MNNTKQMKRSLVLSKQTIRNLRSDELANVAGGVLEQTDTVPTKPDACKTTLPTHA